jgi:N utilization substance protein A
MASKKFIQALDLLEEERGIKKEIVLEALKEALQKSYKKNYLGPESIVRVEINEKTGKIRLFEVKTVVDNLENIDDEINDDFQIELDDARDINPNYQVGDEVVTEVSPEIFGRLAAIQTKQLLRQSIREAEKDALYEEYADKEDDIITGVVDRVEPKFAIINIGKTGAILQSRFQIPGEKLVDGQHINVYVTKVERDTKGTHISVSRTDAGLVKRLFEKEVPEIFDGVVEIKSVSREAGERSKIAVYTENENIDPVGACVGPKGTRVRNVVGELNGEMIDIVEWDKDPAVYITHALAPSKVISVNIDEEAHTAYVIVPDNQLSLAIGKKGQNAKLAVRLTGWKIDIKSESEAKEEGIEPVMADDKEFEEIFMNEMISEEETKEEVIETEEEFVVEENIQDSSNNDSFEEDDEEFDEDYEYDPKYDEDIDYDEYDEYYDDK